MSSPPATAPSTHVSLSSKCSGLLAIEFGTGVRPPSPRRGGNGRAK
jgi:hypothetical protein